MLLIIDFSRMTWVTFLKEKYEVLEKLKYSKHFFENEIGMSIKFLRSNRGGEFTSNEFEYFYDKHGI